MKKNILIIAFVALMGLVSCDKFLDTMPDNRAEIDTPEKIRAILTTAYPSGTYLTTNEYMSDNVDQIGHDNPSSSRFLDQLYGWEDVTEGSYDSPSNFWDHAYYSIAHANQALYAIQQIAGQEPGGELDIPGIEAAGLTAEMAEALLCRAYNHFLLVNEFCLNYSALTSDTDPGIPYMEKAETKLNPKYERGSVAHVYEMIDKDLQNALPYVSEKYYKVPKYHFNVKAAYAFASRFYLFYEKWDKAADYATKCLGSQPEQMLRSWQRRSTLSSDWEVLTNDFIAAGDNANLMLLTSFSAVGYSFSRGAYSKYSHNSYNSFTETFFAKNVWGNPQPSWRSNYDWFWECPTYWVGSTTDYISVYKIPFLFEYTDPVAQIGYAHAVAPAFTSEEVLLNRAEAYVMLNRYDEAAQDLTTWVHSILKPQKYNGTLTPEIIQNFYSAVPYWKYDAPTVKHHLNPSFAIGAEGGVKENMLQCVLGFRRMALIYEGIRWWDIKRYGIVIYRRILEQNPGANRGTDPYVIFNEKTDSLAVNDPRRAIQLPQEVITAGLTPNERAPQPEQDMRRRLMDLPIALTVETNE